MRAIKGGPNVIELHDFYEDHAAFYIVCDLCSGGDLMGRLAKKKVFSEKDVAQYCMQILKALQWCHRNGVVHRDLKCVSTRIAHFLQYMSNVLVWHSCLLLQARELPSIDCRR